MHSKGIVIIGAGSAAKFAKEIFDAREEQVIGYLDNFVPKETIVCDVPVLGGWDFLEDPEFLNNHRFIVTLGKMRTRRRVYDILKDRGGELCSAIHPGAAISPYAVIGEGVLIDIFAHVFADAKIDMGCLIEGHCIVGIDVCLGENVLMGTGVLTNGASQIDNDTFMGAGSVLLPKVSVGSDCYIGSGAVIPADIADGKLAYGVPAHAVRDVDPSLMGD